MSQNTHNWINLLNNEFMICNCNTNGTLESILDPQYIPIIKNLSNIYNSKMSEQLNLLYKAMISEKYLSEYD